MPWESRIQSDLFRRVVIAALMMVLLACSTSLALWMTHARSSVELESVQNIGNFRMVLPGGWVQRRSTEQEEPRLLAVFELPGPQRRLLQVLAIDFGEAHSPAASLKAISQRYFPRAGVSPVAAIDHEGLPAVYRHGRTAQVTQRGRLLQMHMAITLTRDGRRHLALYMTGLGNPQREDRNTMLAIAETVVDTNYTLIEEPTVDLPSMRFTIPEGLLAMRRNNSTDRVHMVPTARTVSRADIHGHLLYMTLNTGLVVDNPENDEPAEALPVDELNQLLLTLLTNVYRENNGNPPPPEAWISVQLDDCVMRGLHWPRSPGVDVLRTLWAGSTDGKTMATLDVRASLPIARTSLIATKAVMAGLTPNEITPATKE